MASDHLWLRIVFGAKHHKVLMYSPSTIKGLKEELSLRHGVSVDDMEIIYDGSIQTNEQRVIDGRLYEMRRGMSSASTTHSAVEEGVFVGEGVTLTQDIIIHHSRGAQRVKEEKKVYSVFGYRGIVHLVDMEQGSVLSPASLLRLGSALLYVDWSTLHPLLPMSRPIYPETEWLRDRLRRDYGITEDSDMKGIHLAGIDGITRYQKVVMNWLDAMGLSEEEEEEEEEEEFEEEEEEEEEDEFWR
jgi:hypothetical protein